jgi:hypothetical protein
LHLRPKFSSQRILQIPTILFLQRHAGLCAWGLMVLISDKPTLYGPPQPEEAPSKSASSHTEKIVSCTLTRPHHEAVIQGQQTSGLFVIFISGTQQLSTGNGVLYIGSLGVTSGGP